MSDASGASATRERTLFADRRRKVHYLADVSVLIQILFTFRQDFLDVTVNRPLPQAVLTWKPNAIGCYLTKRVD